MVYRRSLETTSVVPHLTSTGDYLVVSDSYDGLIVYALVNPEYPVRLGLIDLGAGVEDVVAVGSDIEANMMCTVLLKGLGIPYIAARARTQLHGRALERMGAYRVIFPEREMGSRVARNLFNPDVIEYMELAAGFGISKMKAPPTLEGLTLKEAGLSGTRDKYSLSILAIRRGKDLILLPSEEERLRSEDLLVLANKDDMLDRLYQARDAAPARP